MCDFLQHTQQKYFLLPCYTTVRKASYSAPENELFSNMTDHFIKQKNCVTLAKNQCIYHHVVKFECLNFLITTQSSTQDFVLLTAIICWRPFCPTSSTLLSIAPSPGCSASPVLCFSPTTHCCRLAFR